MLKSFRYVLFPFALIYEAVIWVRNFLFNKNIFKSSAFNFPIICVGNLAVGGTGKTPMVEYLVRLLQDKYQVATLSRGYKRKTKGFAIANKNTTALEIGDEPMQFHQKFEKLTVAVGEERLVAIPQLLYEKPNTKVIILDDALQHRSVRAGLNLLLTEYANLFTRDFMMPTGDLRDLRSSANRANMIIVTKCKPTISVEEKEKIIAEINPASNQQIFFTTIHYGNPYHLFTKELTTISNKTQVLLLCGIANPLPLKKYLNQEANSYEMLSYTDHHIFDSNDLKEIKQKFLNWKTENKIIITTEKDAVRMEKFKKELLDFPIYVLPIEHQFLFNESNEFDKNIIEFIETFQSK